MNRPRNQHTIAASCSVSGRGYWSGKQVTVWIHPGKVDTGVQLVRTDLPHNESSTSPGCMAATRFRKEHQLRTVLQNGEATFSMVEHLMAALYAMEVDNCIVEIDGEEFPALDGSSQGYVDVLTDAGMVMQAAPRAQLVIDRVIRVGNSESWVEASPTTDMTTRFEYQLDYGEGPIGKQHFACRLSTHQFRREIASARTFITDEQAQQLLSAGVGAHVQPSDLLWFSDTGLVNNELRYEDECARHKTLDMIGDLALAGMELVGRFVSFRGGHNLNGRLATELARLAETATALNHRRVA